ncbi:MAG: glucosyl-3-phosphoglycerate synthase [Thermoleophilaceae bacterium]
MIPTFHHRDFPLGLLLERKRGPVTIVLPAREVADTIVPIVESLLSLDELVDEVLVVDAASEDGSAELAHAAGAEVHQESDLMPEIGPVQGKGDAMWRALSVARGEVVVFLDSDTHEFSSRFATGLLGPLLTRPEVEFVKGSFKRPFMSASDDDRALGGGRVTELTARPLLSAFYPELAGFGQPLAGEFAARRRTLDQLPFHTGFAIEIAMLFDARDLVGIGAMAQVDLEERRNPHQPLSDLGPMAYAVLRTVIDRLRRDGRLADGVTPPLQTADGRLVEVELTVRPPHASLRARA